MALYNFFKKNFYFIILLIPFIEFINKNFSEITIEIFFYFLIYSIIILISILVIFFLIDSILKKNRNELRFLLSISFYIFFKFHLFKSYINNYKINYDGEISIFLIFLIIFSLFYLNKYLIINKFLKLFLLSYLVIIISTLIFSFFDKYDKNSKNIIHVQPYFSQEELLNIKDKKNIYYVIVDGMTSLSNFEQKYDEKNTLFKEFIKKNDLVYYDTKSAYTSTLINFTSFLNLNYTYDEKEKKFDRSKMFPETMKPHLVHKYPLFQVLKTLSINFFWEGVPHPGTCIQYNIDFCINYEKKNKIDIFLDRLKMNRFILIAFLKSTPVESFLYRFNLYKKYKNNYPEFEENNSIDKFINKTKNFKYDNKSYFFLIHHLSPHDPYIYRSDCAYQDHKKALKIYPEGYKDAYQCVLKKIQKLVEFIDKKDPNGIIVIQGDHGGGFGENDLEIREDAIKTFTLLKLNNTRCRNLNLANKLDMINTVRLLLSCATNQIPNLLEKKTYFKINNRLVER